MGDYRAILHHVSIHSLVRGRVCPVDTEAIAASINSFQSTASFEAASACLNVLPLGSLFFMFQSTASFEAASALPCFVMHKRKWSLPFQSTASFEAASAFFFTLLQNLDPICFNPQPRSRPRLPSKKRPSIMKSVEHRFQSTASFEAASAGGFFSPSPSANSRFNPQPRSRPRLPGTWSACSGNLCFPPFQSTASFEAASALLSGCKETHHSRSFNPQPRSRPRLPRGRRGNDKVLPRAFQSTASFEAASARYDHRLVCRVGVPVSIHSLVRGRVCQP